MTCKIIMMEIAKSGGIHVSDTCLSPSLEWLSPTKIDSSSTDFDAPLAQEALHENGIKERSNDRNSMSEFEFAMSTIKHENMHGEHMLAADELFFKGKLLPLYNPNYTDGSVNQHISRHNMRSQANHPISSCSLYIDDADNSQAIKRDATAPASPKTPKCSIMLKELFGLKKRAKSLCACTASGEVATGSSCKSSKCGGKKGKAAKNKQKASLVLQVNAPQAICKASHLFCASSDADCIAGMARNSASEPLLTARLGCQPQAGQDGTALSAACMNTFDIACIQRSNRVSDSLYTHKDSHEQRSLLGFLSDEEDQCRKSTGQQNAGSRRWSLQMGLGTMSLGKSFSGASNCEENAWVGLPGVQNRGLVLAPVGMRSGDMRPKRNPCRNLCSYGENTCRGMTTEHQSRGAMRTPQMRRHIGETSPERGSPSGLNAMVSQSPRYPTSEMLKSTEISRTISLERSSSHSPKSLQRKYEQLKAIRQREGWRMLERSSSYNSGMHSMRVAPVLNMPIVCMSRSKSSNHGMPTRRKA